MGIAPTILRLRLAVLEDGILMTGRATLTAQEEQFVQEQRVGHLATSDEAGHPYVVPVCYAFDGERFYTPLDEKPKRVEANKLRRVRNIEARHEAALVIDRYTEDWSNLATCLCRGAPTCSRRAMRSTPTPCACCAPAIRSIAI